MIWLRRFFAWWMADIDELRGEAENGSTMWG